MSRPAPSASDAARGGAVTPVEGNHPGDGRRGGGSGNGTGKGPNAARTGHGASSAGPRGWRVLLTGRWAGLTALALVIAAACVLLGRWQLSRFEYRSDYNRLVTRNSTAAPVDVTTLLAGLPAGHDITSGREFRQVYARGRYDTDKTLVVRQRTYADTGSQGFEVLTPLRTDRGTVLVDRGWVPAGGDPLATPTVPAAPMGLVEVRGLLRDSERGDTSPFAHLPPTQVKRIDTAAVSQHLGVALLPGYVQLGSQVPPLSDGIQVLPRSVDHQNAALNLAYTVQWWVFALVALGALLVFARREVRDASSAGETGGEQVRTGSSTDSDSVASSGTGVPAAVGSARSARPVAAASPGRERRQRRSELRAARSRRGRERSRDEWLAQGEQSQSAEPPPTGAVDAPEERLDGD